MLFISQTRRFSQGIKCKAGWVQQALNHLVWLRKTLHVVVNESHGVHLNEESGVLGVGGFSLTLSHLPTLIAAYLGHISVFNHCWGEKDPIRWWSPLFPHQGGKSHIISPTLCLCSAASGMESSFINNSIIHNCSNLHLSLQTEKCARVKQFICNTESMIATKSPYEWQLPGPDTILCDL